MIGPNFPFGAYLTALLRRDCDYAKRALAVVVRTRREEQLVGCGAGIKKGVCPFIAIVADKG